VAQQADDLGEILLLAVSRMHRLQVERLSQLKTSLTLRQYRILQRVSEGYTSLSELSRLSHRSLPSTSESVELLVRRKLLTRQVSQVDRRAMELGLTPAGRTALAQGKKCMADLSEGFLAQFPKSKQPALAQLVHRMYDYAGDLMWELTHDSSLAME
jgi:DNA-binding MarR family transcriptional regulator